MHPTELRGIVQGAVVASLLAVVAACGGGGGGGGGSSNPVISTTSFTTNENVALNGTLTASDPNGGAVTFAQGTPPASGKLSGFTSAGAFVYTPNANYTGSDSFTVTATDTAGHATTGTISITVTVDQPPTANSTIVRDDTPAATSGGINVLANASDPDKDKLTVSISTPASLGTAAVNSDSTVSISGLPGDFKGLVHFGYTVTDPSGKTATAGAAVFVGADPFRASFVADSDPNGSGQYEVYLADFAAAPVKQSAATQGSSRLQGYAISDNGATIVYRSSSSTSPLSFVQTASPSTQVAIPLPGGAAPVQDASGNDQFVVSSDGKWIAVIAGTTGNNSLYVVSVANPPVVTQITPAISGVTFGFASQPQFNIKLGFLYFLASPSGGTHKSLFLASLANLNVAPTLYSQESDPATTDDITAYSEFSSGAAVEQASRGGREGIYYVAKTGVETEIDTQTTGVAVTSSTAGLAPGYGGSNTGTAVAYDVGVPVTSPTSTGIYFDTLSTPPPTPQFVIQLQTVLGFNPDDTKLLYTDGAQVGEIAAAAGSSGTTVGVGSAAWYDSTGNIVLVEDNPGAAGGSTLSYNVRPFASPLGVTPSGSVGFAVDVSGFPQGVVLLGEAQSGGSAPASVNLQLVNVLAENAPGVATPSPLYLSSLGSTPSSASPVHLTSYVSKVVQ